jgi:hypothetical protein
MEYRGVQYEILKKMSPQQKLEVSMNLYHSARKLKAAWLRQLHSDWSEEKVQQEVREIFVNARS